MQTESGLSHCPRCDHELPADPRYVTWCDRCDWNVDPHPEHHKVAAWQQRRQTSVYREWERGAVNRPGSLAARASAYLVTLPVLLIPRSQALPSDAQPVSREDAPGLYGVLDELGWSKPAVCVHTGPTVSYLRRFRPVLCIGTSYWSALEPQERVAVIAHKLSLAKSSRLALAVARARRLLTGLLAAFEPGPLDEARQDEPHRVLNNTVVSAQDDVVVSYYLAKLGNLLFGPPLRLYLKLFERVTLPFTLHAVYAADRRAADLAGTEAAVRALEKSVLADTAFRALERALRYNRDETPTAAARRAVTEVPPRELDRRIRLTRLCSQPDRPPTYLRLQLLRSSAAEPRVVLTADTDQELKPATDAALAALRREL